MVAYREFENLDVQVLGISADNPFSQSMFAASMELPYPLLSDHPDLGAFPYFRSTYRRRDLLALTSKQG